MKIGKHSLNCFGLRQQVVAIIINDSPQLISGFFLNLAGFVCWNELSYLGKIDFFFVFSEDFMEL